jgi:fructose-1,6-bisphosphatase/sedoheptulose 1,7-bisphosphatase-like protein
VTELTEAVDPRPAEQGTSRYCLCESYARVTERAALAGARWLGRADQEAAKEAAYSGMQLALERLPISGRIVIGGEEDGESLVPDSDVGAGGDRVDLAVDPLEGRGVLLGGLLLGPPEPACAG